MTRVKRGTVTKKRHKRLLKKTKGFWGQRKNVFKRAKETLLRSMAYAFHGRKLKKRDMRSLFVTRISAAVKGYSISYSKFINMLNKAEIKLNRKMLSQLAILDPQVFEKVVEVAKK
jgi:large subunit ribosomal protein L20